MNFYSKVYLHTFQLNNRLDSNNFSVVLSDYYRVKYNLRNFLRVKEKVATIHTFSSGICFWRARECIDIAWLKFLITHRAICNCASFIYSGYMNSMHEKKETHINTSVNWVVLQSLGKQTTLYSTAIKIQFGYWKIVHLKGKCNWFTWNEIIKCMLGTVILTYLQYFLFTGLPKQIKIRNYRHFFSKFEAKLGKNREPLWPIFQAWIFDFKDHKVFQQNKRLRRLAIK